MIQTSEQTTELGPPKRYQTELYYTFNKTLEKTVILITTILFSGDF